MMMLASALGVLRALIMSGSGALIGHGISSAETFSNLPNGTIQFTVGLIVAALTLAWGMKQHIATSAQFMSLLRGLVAAFGGWAIHKGWATASEVTTWAGLLSTLGPMVWSIFVHYHLGVAENADRRRPF